ncbi:MAG TPA: hypothetical protein VG013_18760 [Gemmataceae bacterium]|nr:hypothetical protein [Gemmataceae bacterium]
MSAVEEPHGQDRENHAMYEVILTYRPDFTERVIERYATAEEAAAVAEHISARHHDQVIRAWIRQVREVQTNP